HTSWVNDVAWSPDGQYIVSGAESESIRLWDAQTGEALQAVNQDNYRAIRRVAWSADSQFIAFESHRNDVTIWDREAWQAVQVFDDRTSYMAWSPDGRRMALVDLLNNMIRFRDVLTGQEMRSIELEFAYQTE
ncbi:MAG TPA: hypothetical protein PLZ51_07915, partial [Aggregatilineales bacterium]|nr:hypothetical protein [Aggregatilineales bacterium]